MNIFKNKNSSITGNSDSPLHKNVSKNYFSSDKDIGLSGMINPRVENRFGDIHSSENYREILVFLPNFISY